MNDLVKTIGHRLSIRRKALGYSQEETARKAGVHPTYVGQVERGEKNATMTSLSKICGALNLPLEQLFEGIDSDTTEKSVAEKCYTLVTEQPLEEQLALYEFLKNAVVYKRI